MLAGSLKQEPLEVDNGSWRVSNLDFVFVVAFFEQFFSAKLEDCVQLLLVEWHCATAAHTHTHMHANSYYLQTTVISKANGDWQFIILLLLTHARHQSSSTNNCDLKSQH